jgi:hypothetical protein
MDKSDRLLLNISSGTPAMKSGLLVRQTLGEFDYKLIQAATPQRGMNEHVHTGYDVAMLWPRPCRQNIQQVIWNC